MIWSIALALGVCFWSVAIRLKFRGPGTLYFLHPFGFVARRVGGPDPDPPRIGFDEFDRLLPHFVAGERFDWLGLSSGPEGTDGITLDHDEGELLLEVDFRTRADEAEEACMRSAMSHLGLDLPEEEVHNQGLGDLETRDLRYRLPRDIDAIGVAVRTAMRLACGIGEGDEFYVEANRSGDFPRGRLGYWLEPDQDLVEGLI